MWEEVGGRGGVAGELETGRRPAGRAPPLTPDSALHTSSQLLESRTTPHFRPHTSSFTSRILAEAIPGSLLRSRPALGARLVEWVRETLGFLRSLGLAGDTLWDVSQVSMWRVGRRKCGSRAASGGTVWGGAWKTVGMGCSTSLAVREAWPYVQYACVKYVTCVTVLFTYFTGMHTSHLPTRPHTSPTPPPQVAYCLASVVRSVASPLLPLLASATAPPPPSAPRSAPTASSSAAAPLRRGLWEAFSSWAEEGYASGETGGWGAEEGGGEVGARGRVGGSKLQARLSRFHELPAIATATSPKPLSPPPRSAQVPGRGAEWDRGLRDPPVPPSPPSPPLSPPSPQCESTRRWY